MLVGYVYSKASCIQKYYSVMQKYDFENISNINKIDMRQYVNMKGQICS